MKKTAILTCLLIFALTTNAQEIDFEKLSYNKIERSIENENSNLFYPSLFNRYNILNVAENEFGIEGFYFDVSPCLNSMKNMFK